MKHDSSRTYSESVKLYRKKRLLRLATRSANLFAEFGIAGVSMDRVANHSGVSKAVLYRYFGSKGDLVESILADIVNQINQLDARNLSWGRQLVEDNLKIIRENQDAFLLLVRHARYDPIFGQHYVQLFEVLLEHTVGRMTASVSNHNQTVTKFETSFVAERITHFILDSFNAWVESGVARHDDKFVEWLVYSVNDLSKRTSAL